MPDFDRMIRDNAPALARFSRSQLGDPWLADEAVQQTLERAWKYRESFQATGSQQGWLIRICRNVICDLVGDRAADACLEQISELDVASVELDVARAEVSDLIESLPCGQRDVVVVCALLGYDYAAASTILDVPIGTVRSRLHRARATLAHQLADHVAEAPPGTPLSEPLAA